MIWLALVQPIDFHQGLILGKCTHGAISLHDLRCQWCLASADQDGAILA